MGKHNVRRNCIAKVAPVVGYNKELQKRRFDFEIRKFEAEEARRREKVERQVKLIRKRRNDGGLVN